MRWFDDWKITHRPFNKYKHEFVIELPHSNNPVSRIVVANKGFVYEDTKLLVSLLESALYSLTKGQNEN